MLKDCGDGRSQDEPIGMAKVRVFPQSGSSGACCCAIVLVGRQCSGPSFSLYSSGKPMFGISLRPSPSAQSLTADVSARPKACERSTMSAGTPATTAGVNLASIAFIARWPVGPVLSKNRRIALDSAASSTAASS